MNTNIDRKFVMGIGKASHAMREGKTNDVIISMLENDGYPDKQIIEIFDVIRRANENSMKDWLY